MKKLFACIVLILCCLLPLAACDNPQKKPNPTVEDNRPLLGVWWWSDSLGDEYLDFAQQNGVTEIYFCTGKMNDSTDAFIQKANSRNMKVYWLAGEYQWVENNSSAVKQVEKYLTYQGKYQHKFEGIHFDIEPQQHADWHTRRSELLTQFVQLTKLLAQSYPDVWIEYDIQFSWEENLTFDGATKPVFAHVIDNASRVTIMSYRDTAEKIYSVSKSELDYAQSIGKPLNLGVNTKSNEGDQVSFQEEGKQAMYTEIAKLRDNVPDNVGVVVHQIKHWYSLQD